VRVQVKKVTIRDVSEKAGVSATTVSMILNNKPELRVSSQTRQKVLQAAEELGYKKSSKKSGHVSNLIGLIVPTLNNPFFTNLISSVEMHARANGYNVILCNTERKAGNEIPFIQSLIKHNVDGIILALTPTDPGYIVEASRIVPIIVVGETNINNNLITIGLDSYKAGEIAAEHLYSLGHRAIAYLTTPIGNVSLSRRRRLEGIKDYYRKRGFGNSIYVYEGKDEYESQEAYEIELGSVLIRKMLQDKKDITAVVIVGDLMAPGIYHTLEEHGLKIPRDISVIGFDNNFITKFLNPRLTTIEHFLDARAKLAIEQIISIINGSQEGEMLYSVEITPKLIVRESTGPRKDR